jgi:flavin reductase (DIM6/NTAB) family NADH-FMN oxidoreductase RutF
MSAPAAADQVLTPDRFRRFMAHWPTAVSVVTARADEAPIGCTVNALMSVSIAPPLLVVSLAAGSGTLDAIVRSGSFAINLLGWEQRELCDRFSREPREERFRGVDFRLKHGVPVLAQSTASVVCAVTQTLVCADHVLVLGAPRWHSVDTACPPLVLHRRSYRRLAD